MSKVVKKISKVLSVGGIIPSLLGAGEKPEVTGSVAAPETTPTAVSADTMEAREAQRKRQLASAGLGGTVLTGAGGLSPSANTAGKSLLGS